MERADPTVVVSKWKRPPVLVTGGASFIGSHLVDALVEQNARVTVVDDLSSGRLEHLHRPKHWLNVKNPAVRRPRRKRIGGR
jgi:nucleoside-diphosphate-sugar epimerase